jgi:hypothetical protein
MSQGQPITVKAANANITLLEVKKGIIVGNAAGGNITLTLPDVGANEDGLQVTVKSAATSATNDVVVDGGTNDVDGAASYTIPDFNDAVTLAYVEAIGEWIILSIYNAA